MESIKIKDLDLDQIANSGQCFTWEPLGPRRYGVEAFGHWVEVEQNGDQFRFSCDQEEFDQVWRGYFDLDTDYGELKAAVDPEDHYLSQAVCFGGGIRVLRQDLWEVMVSFLISQNNNIPRIKNSIAYLCRSYGEKKYRCKRGQAFYTFPKPDDLKNVTEEEFKAAGLGYRAKYLPALVQKAEEGLLSRLKAAELSDARQLLLSSYGIGKKVADCICLFGLHQKEAFPVDTHIQKILALHYPKGFPEDRYPGVQGVIQQYLFYYHLKGK